MKKSILSVVLLLTILGLCVRAFPLAAGHPPGHPVRQNRQWPAGLADMLNSPGRVHGYFINANDFFFYQGDIGDFNPFLEQYAKLEKTPLTLVLHPGQGKTSFITPGDKEITFDWKVDLFCRGWAREAPPDPTGKQGKYVIVMEAWFGGQLELDKVKVPLNVKVKLGEADEKLAKFAAAHEAKRKRAEAESKATKPPTTIKEPRFHFINLDPYTTTGLELFHGGAASSDLPLEPGEQRIGGFRFRVGEGVIHLGGSALKEMPTEVTGIKVGLKFNRLRILHGTSWDERDGTRIGRYVVHYGDGSTAEIPIQYGVHVKNWWADWGSFSEVSGAEAAWTPGSRIAPPVRLYCLTWSNPHPEKEVTTIDCVSTGTECAPFVVAMAALTTEGTTSIALESKASGLYRCTSDRPRYAKVALNKDGSKVLALLFDESKGTEKGYDLLLADANFNGRFEKTEIFKAGTLEANDRVISSSFPPYEVRLLYDEKGGIAARWQIAFGYHMPRETRSTRPSVWESEQPQNTVGNFHITANLALGQRSVDWRYYMSGDVQTSESLETAPVWTAIRSANLKLATRPDGQTKGNLGISLQLDAGENELACDKGGAPTKAHVEIKKSDGTIVHKDDETLDKFVFG